MYAHKEKPKENKSQNMANNIPETMQLRAKKLSAQKYQDGVLQMKLLPRESIATDLAHYEHVRKALFTRATLLAYPGPEALNSGEREDQNDYKHRLMSEKLENNPVIRYKPLEEAKFFTSNESWKMVSHLKKSSVSTETMFLLKGGFIGIANKKDATYIHPRVFGGMPDVDMAGTVVVNNLRDIPVGDRDIKTLSAKEKRKALMGWQGGINFTNDSGHYKFDSLSNKVQKTLTGLAKGERELTEDIQVGFVEL